MEENIQEDSTPLRKRTGPKPGVRKIVKVEVTGYEVGRGRTKRVVFDEDIYKLAQIGCTDKEIAQWFDMTESTLRYNFRGILEKGRAELQQRLRKAQINLALEGNAVMLIWLGKQILNQRDQPVSEDANRILPFTDDEDDAIDVVTMDSDVITLDQDAEPSTTEDN